MVQAHQLLHVLNLFKNSGVPNENVIMCDRKGVIYRGREGELSQWKSKHAIDTKR